MKILRNATSAIAQTNYVWTEEGAPTAHRVSRRDASKGLLTPRQEELLVYVEAAGTLLYDFRRSNGVTDVVVSMATFYRTITGKSAIGGTYTLFTGLANGLGQFVPFWQSTIWIDVLDSFHKNTHRVRDSALGQKFISVFNHVVAHTFYHKMGIEVDPKLFHQIEKGYIRKNIWNVASFADAILGLLLFLAKAGRQALLTGSANPFFVDSDTVSDWVTRASRLRKDSEFLGNPGAVGLDQCKYLADLDRAIEEGQALGKIFRGTQQATLINMTIELEMVLKRQMSVLAASSFRWCPIGINLFGDAGVGKSFIMKGLYNHYCSIRGIEPYLYLRNPTDKFYSGFKSYMSGIALDDVACHKAAKVIGIDMTITDLLSLINNQPYLTNQAESCDKGKIPVLAEWVGLTSNNEDLNISAFFNNTHAVLRRIPYRIEPTVKEDFRVPGTNKLDSSKVPKGQQYPDCWSFEVCRVLQHTDDANIGYYEPRGHGTKYDSYGELLEWITGVYEAHIAAQTKLMATVADLGPEKLCKCRVPESICRCDGVDTIFGTQLELALPEAQAFTDEDLIAEILDEDTSSRVDAVFQLRKEINITYGHLTGATKTYAQRWWFNGFPAEAIKPTFEDKLPIKDLLHKLKCDFKKDVADFANLSIRCQMTLLNRLVDRVPTSDDYLTFIPKKYGKRNFMRQQLKRVYDHILGYTKIAGWNAQQERCLEMFIHEKVPGYLGEGWDDDSILRAAFDYVDTFSPLFTDEASPLRTETFDRPTWRDAAVRQLGMLYFSNSWVFSSVNYVASTRPGGAVIRTVGAAFATPARLQVSLARSAARVRDVRLGGTHPVVVLIVTVCASAAIFSILTMGMRFVTAKSQVDLDEVGKKPKVREGEKKNVWVVEEPNITSLDFQRNRRNSIKQLEPSIIKNSVLIRFTGNNGRTYSGTTRGFVINNTTLVMNNHACVTGSCLQVYFLQKTHEGCQATFEIILDETMITRFSKRDLAIVRTRAMPAVFKDIRSNLPKRGLQYVDKSSYYILNEEGEVEELPIHGTGRHQLKKMQGVDAEVDIMSYGGRPERPTKSGECGSVLVMRTAYGPLIVGIHCAFNPYYNLTHATPIFYEDFEHCDMVEVGIVTPSAAVAQVRVHKGTIPLRKSDKLFTNYYETGQMVVFGQLQGFRPRMKASGGKTEIAEHVLEYSELKNLGVQDNMVLPDMGSWEPQQNILKEYMVPTHSMRESIFDVSVETFIAHVGSCLTQDDVDDLHPVPLSVAINGYPAVPNVDALKFTTSAGHGFEGPKAKYVCFDDERDEWSRYREFTPEVVARIQEIYEMACQGQRSHPIFTAQLKNEMVSVAKRAIKKTRGFYMCPVDFLTAMRILTSGLTRVMVRRKHVFRHAVGLNTHSLEWDELYRLSEKIPGENWMAGDFKGFDKILSILIQNGAKDVILGVARLGSFTREEILALDTMLCDTITPTVDFFGTLVMFLGGEVSGHQLTTFFNSICNVLLHSYAFVSLAQDQGIDRKEAGKQFFEKVFICVLGDDIQAKVHPDCPWYNHTSVQAVFKSIGIEYTMADKSSASRAYISRDEVTFLKRSYATHECFPGKIVAPLEKASIYKMLLYTIPSKAVSEEIQLAQSMCAAVSEAFYHGREFFETIWDLIASAPKSAELEERMRQIPLPTWPQLIERYYLSSGYPRGMLGNPEHDCAESKPAETDSYCQSEGAESQCDWSVDPWSSTAMERSSEVSFQRSVQQSTPNLQQLWRVEKTVVVENDLLSKNHKKDSNSPSLTSGQMAPVKVETAINNKLHSKALRKKKKQQWRDRVVWQASIVMDPRVKPPMKGTGDYSQQTTSFANEPDSLTVDMSKEAPPTSSKMTLSQGLGEYLSRPKLVHTQTWLESAGTGIIGTVYPWDLYLTSAQMVAKLQGFSLLRGNLCVKFIVNGSPFYYGALMAAYTPLPLSRRDTAAGNVNTQLVAYSQKPHVWLNVQETSSAQMKLPFLYPYPFVDTQLITNIRDLGKFDYYVYSQLRSANGVTGSAVDVQMYAWMEDVELAGPSDQAIAQADIEYQDDHQISDVAATVANVAGKLKYVPGLAPYAMATEAAAKMAGGVASLFGYTNVPNISDVQPIKQMPFSLASTSISEPITKLSLQPKQEIALGSTQFGGPSEDEMSIQSFVSRKSFVVGTNWTTTQIPGDVLFTSAVTPYMYQTSGAQVAFTPMAYLSQYFQWWRGDIEFTFKVIRSPYHRGRVQISWDRASNNLSEGALLGNPNTLNVIMDLDETDEISMVVPYSQPQQFLTCSHTNAVPGSLQWSTSATPTGGLSDVNGVINVRVMNRLTAPEATSDVTVLVFVKACDNFELAGPLEWGVRGNDTLSLNNATVGVAQADMEYTEAPKALAPPSEVPEVLKEVFGEKVVSLREFLHRQSLSKTVNFDTDTAAAGQMTLTVPLKRLPPAPGVFNNGWDTGTTSSGAGQTVFYCRYHPLTAITACFVGYKGSVNVSANFRASSTAPVYADSFLLSRRGDARTALAINRQPYISFVAASTTKAIIANVANRSSAFSDDSGLSGVALTNTRTNTGLSANLPYYVNSGFLVSDMTREYNNTQTLGGTQDDWWTLRAKYSKGAVVTTTDTLIDVYYGSGPDFDLVFFLNVPILHQVNITAV